VCYAYKPVFTASGTYEMHRLDDIHRMMREGKVKETREGFFFAKDTVPVIIGNGEVRPMRWDLIPAEFMWREKPGLPEVIKAKNSRAKGSQGFSSYNARIETVQSLWAFKEPWKSGKRGVMPVAAWRERPNMDGAPAEFRGREYEVTVEPFHFLAALYDTWEGREGERLDSCTVITGPSDGIPALRGIWHERAPIVLSEATAEAWLDPGTSPDAAYALLRGAPVPDMTIREIRKSPGEKAEVF
jgi:putative SOS response-associated peptidase YedK